MATRWLKVMWSVCLMLLSSLSVMGQQDIIEHKGNKYIIHVERLNPDAEMTLLDVLQICPELMSTDGKTLTDYYVLTVDDIFLSADYEPLLIGIKASDLSEVIVCTYGAVDNATDGTTGTIDLQFREGKGPTGKVELSGSTYGNGRLFADMASRSGNVAVHAFAQTNLQYGRAEDLSGTNVTSRNGVENAMLFVDWQVTKKDLLTMKLSQGYGERCDRLHNPIAINDGGADMIRQRWGEFAATYERTLNEHGASLYLETGLSYSNNTIYDSGLREATPWWIAECSIPFLNQSLNMTVGYEGGYMNDWYQEIRREQNLYNDLYLMLNYKKGPWIACLGDRFRHNTFWDKHYDEDDGSLWSHNRNDHALFASVGYRQKRHFMQGIVSRSFFNPFASDFHVLEEGDVQHDTDYKTNLAWRMEAHYTYQTERLVASGSVTHTLLTDMAVADQSLTGLGATVSWRQGPLRLTAGANAYRLHYDDDDDDDETDTYFILKLAPTLLLGKGFRLSSTLIYNSRQDIYDQHAHLYASVKLGKQLGERCHVSADFHDLADQPTGASYFLRQSFMNRALSIGITYRPWK